MSETILLAGCGKMGGALLEGWLKEDAGWKDVHIVEPHIETAAFLRGAYGINVVDSASGLPEELSPDLVMFAVKPQMMVRAVPEYQRFANGRTAFLSIAAGTTISFFEEHLGGEAPVIRVMPNTPAAVGRGVSVGVANEKVSPRQRALCHRLMKAVGCFHWIADEHLMDAVTAVSGGGPAYVFHMVEAMASAARSVGLPGDLADTLARRTVEGAGELLHQAEETPETLRKNVTSPGGVTAAALGVLMEEGGGLTELMTEAAIAARDRGKELAG